MNRHRIARLLLKGTPLDTVDAARLILESMEHAESLLIGLNRAETMERLRQIMRAGTETVKREVNTVTLKEAAMASLSARHYLRPTTRRDLRFFVRRMLRTGEYNDIPLRSFTTQHCRGLLEIAFGSCPSSYAKGRSVLHSIFAHGIQLEWCDHNPVDRVSVPRIRERSIHPLTLAEIRRLKRAATRPKFRDMKFSLSLLLYCGIRPTEISRLQAHDICWSSRQVIIRPRASKTGGGRVVPLRCVRGISAQERIIPQNWGRRWKALRAAAGFRCWTPDVCRHTFASYHAAHFRNLPALQLEMGHRDSTLLRTRYVSPVNAQMAARFWREAEFPASSNMMHPIHNK